MYYLLVRSVKHMDTGSYLWEEETLPRQPGRTGQAVWPFDERELSCLRYEVLKFTIHRPIYGTMRHDSAVQRVELHLKILSDCIAFIFQHLEIEITNA